MNDDPALVPHYRRNLALLSIGGMSFVIGMSFSDPNTVLPTFARELTSSAPLIGMIATLQSGAWMLPQLFAANFVANKPRKAPYVFIPCAIGRPLYFVLAATTLFWAKTHPLLALLSLYFCNTWFYMTDGLASASWFDVLAKTMPGRLRGRFLLISQSGGGLLGVGAGLIVQRILAPSFHLSYPQNYALLFFIAAIFYALSTFPILFVKEPIESAHAERPTWSRYVKMLGEALRNNRAFRLVIGARLLVGLGNMALPFFVLYALEGLRLSPTIVGLGVTAQVAGRMLAGFFLDYGVRRLGTRKTLLGGLILCALGPALAMVTPLVGLILSKEVLVYFYALAFLFLGVSLNAVTWAFTNYILEIAPPEDRSTYMGLTNTISGVMIVAPLIGGALLQLTNYSVLFAVTLTVYLAAMVIGARLPMHHRGHAA